MLASVFGQGTRSHFRLSSYHHGNWTLSGLIYRGGNAKTALSDGSYGFSLDSAP